jgi:hypothetical protein
LCHRIAFHGGRRIFGRVSRRIVRRLSLLLVVLQLLLSAPLAGAYADIASAGQPDHCAGMMHAGDSADACSCCPDGIQGTAACLSACAASVGAITPLSFEFEPDVSPDPVSPVVIHRADRADPPLKPPPI